ncbi:MAG TPA: AraC family transcriptional regulator [Polyangia bacterium]|nr:AraC family transcriptional regulator [Polyangia bacterium]
MTPAGRIDVLHPAGLPGVVWYRGRRVSHAYPRHWHEELHLCAYSAGDGRLRLRGATSAIGAGDLAITPAGEIHENWVERGGACSFRSLYLDVALVRGLVRQATGDPRSELAFAATRLRAPALRRALIALHRAIEDGAAPLQAEGALVELCGAILATDATRGPSERRLGRERRAVRQAQAFLREHLDELVSLRQLATVTRLSPYYLHRVFCRETGMPPHAFQLQLRINTAKRLMRAGTALAEVAAATGFADQSHLTRHFRRLVGMPPGRFRRFQG